MSEQYTLDEYNEQLPKLTKHGAVVELMNGYLKPVPLYTKYQSKILTQLYARLSYHGDVHDLGYTFDARTGYTINSNTVLHPTLSFLSRNQQQGELDDRIIGAPTIAIEVILNDYVLEQLEHKIRLYLEQGTAMVWVIFAEDAGAELYTLQNDVVQVEELGIGDTLTAPDILPDFELPLYMIFPSRRI